jgi:DNA-binding MarR family transcriptional regulator
MKPDYPPSAGRAMMATLPSDYQERVLHYIEMYPKSFTVDDVASATGVKPGTVARILSAFEDMELVVRRRMHRAQCFDYTPSEASLSLKKARLLTAYAADLDDLRQEELRRHNRYVSRRKLGIV